MGTVKLGPSTDPDTVFGPLSNPLNLRVVQVLPLSCRWLVADPAPQKAIDDMVAVGATLIRNTPVPAGLQGGLFVPPTLVDGAARGPAARPPVSHGSAGVDSRHALAEVFGPVAVLLPFGVEAEAVQICNEVCPAAPSHTGRTSDRAPVVGHAARVDLQPRPRHRPAHGTPGVQFRARGLGGGGLTVSD
jgi:acyl-CoA reductase-like NAD-dependent aldehyde dehydrogenase